MSTRILWRIFCVLVRKHIVCVNLFEQWRNGRAAVNLILMKFFVKMWINWTHSAFCPLIGCAVSGVKTSDCFTRARELKKQILGENANLLRLRVCLNDNRNKIVFIVRGFLQSSISWNGFFRCQSHDCLKLHSTGTIPNKIRHTGNLSLRHKPHRLPTGK